MTLAVRIMKSAGVAIAIVSLTAFSPRGPNGPRRLTLLCTVEGGLRAGNHRTYKLGPELLNGGGGNLCAAKVSHTACGFTGSRFVYEGTPWQGQPSWSFTYDSATGRYTSHMAIDDSGTCVPK